jgi:REP element-mobilizing transposase RayT
MNYDPEKHHRRSIRLKKYDYSSIGLYFVTICTQHRKCLFGNIQNGAMRLNAYGQIVKDEWLKGEILRKEIKSDEFIIMPNHMHAIVKIMENGKCFDFSSEQGASLGSIITGFKSSVTAKINAIQKVHPQKIWQRNYWERILRSDIEFYYCREYIKNNPIKWEKDSLYINQKSS